MKWTRQISREVTKLYLTNEQMTEGLKQAILEVASDYPQNILNLGLEIHTTMQEA